MHSLNIVHRDLKPDNILLTRNYVAKICDFGSAISVDENDPTGTNTNGTLAFLPPEALIGLPYDLKKGDMWAMGCILYAMINGRVPFGDHSEYDTSINIIEGNYQVETFWSSSLADLFKRLLDKDPKKRITVPQLVVHPWITKNNSLKFPFGVKIRQDFRRKSMFKTIRELLHLGKLSGRKLSAPEELYQTQIRKKSQ